MKNFNYILIFFGGLFVAFIFYSFIASLAMFADNLGKIPQELTHSDLNYYYAIRTFALIFGFFIGIFSFHKILQD